MKTVTDYLDVNVNHWWTSMLLGLIYCAIALSLIFLPVISYMVLSAIFSIAILISGLLELLFAISNKRNLHSWGWYLLGSLFDLAIGFYLVFYPQTSLELLPLIVAFWLLFKGFSLCGYAADFKYYGTRDWGWYLSFGILSIMGASFILWQPGFGILYMLYLLAAIFCAMGIFRLRMAFEWKRIHQHAQRKTK